MVKDVFVRPLRVDERTRFFEFARGLPDRDFWGKKGRLLRGDFESFQEIFEYIKSFEPTCFFVAEEHDRLVGFVLAVYNSEWNSELAERYGYDVGKRAYLLGIAVVQRRTEVLRAMINALRSCLGKRNIESIDYPTLGSICLTTATDVLTPHNVDALIMFREAGFKIDECYYSMRLKLDKHKDRKQHRTKEGKLRHKERSIEIAQHDEVLGKITWNPIENGKTSIEVSVTRTHRGKGFGTALMAEALKQLKTQGVNTVKLGVDGNNLPALRLYRKFGFKVYKTHLYIAVPC